MSRRIRLDRVRLDSPESVLWNHARDPSSLFYVSAPPTAAPRAATATTVDHGDARLVKKLGLRCCPCCGSRRLNWRARPDGRVLGKCWDCGRSGTVDELLQRGRRTSPIRFAVKSACRRVAAGVLPRHSLPVSNAVRRAAKHDRHLAAGLDDLAVLVSARLHVLSRHEEPALDPLELPLAVDFMRFLPGRREISRHEARARIRALVAAGVLVRVASPPNRLYRVFRLARGWSGRGPRRTSRQAQVGGARVGRELLCGRPPLLPPRRPAPARPTTRAAVAGAARAGP